MKPTPWLFFHLKSEKYACLAEQESNSDRATELYLLAAEAEVNALDNLDITKRRTVGVTVVSAVSLYFKAKQFSKVRELAEKWLIAGLPAFAVEELNDLLATVR